MAVFIGISRSLSLRELRRGATSFWCVGGQSKTAQPGDQILLYFPVAASRENNGIGQIYRIVGKPDTDYRSDCAHYGMAHVDTELLLNLPVWIKAKDLKVAPGLRDWPVLRRNFQGVTFAVGQDFWPTLRHMIVARNPEADAILESVRVCSRIESLERT